MNSGTWHSRDKAHDAAVRVVVPRLRRYGFVVAPHGREENKELEGLLEQQDDRCSLMVRYRPDIIAAKREWRSCLCEVKASGLIEARAFRALQEWNKGGDVAFIVSCPEPYNNPVAAWIDALQPEPTTVIVPNRWDADSQYSAMQAMFPQSQIQRVAYSGRGSGTPYFPLPKELLYSLDAFIEDELVEDAECPPE